MCIANMIIDYPVEKCFFLHCGTADQRTQKQICKSWTTFAEYSENKVWIVRLYCWNFIFLINVALKHCCSLYMHIFENRCVYVLVIQPLLLKHDNFCFCAECVCMCWKLVHWNKKNPLSFLFSLFLCLSLSQAVWNNYGMFYSSLCSRNSACVFLYMYTQHLTKTHLSDLQQSGNSRTQTGRIYNTFMLKHLCSAPVGCNTTAQVFPF